MMETLTAFGARLVERTWLGTQVNRRQLADRLYPVGANDERTLAMPPVAFDRYRRRPVGDGLWVRGVRTTGTWGCDLPGR